jgi:cytochrome oxidase Cu insertion factor (SCO1/SenC/PrrC family)
MPQSVSRSTLALLLVLPGFASIACQRTTATEAASQAPLAAGASSVTAVAATAPLAAAQLGTAAPDFELSDLDGRRIQLSSFRGKVVVLEWFNPGCPFVNASHTKGSLVGTAARHTQQGVVWLAINSAGPGRQGYGVPANREAAQRFQLAHPILLDESGQVGHAYGAAHTPHLYVIDARGTLVYRGAIDNSPDAEGESAPGGKLVNYVDAALGDLAAGRQVAVAETEAYGCSVKYRN